MQIRFLENAHDDLMVVNAARVSFSKWKTPKEANWKDEKGSDARLLKYLARHLHVTPFFHPQIVFRTASCLPGITLNRLVRQGIEEIFLDNWMFYRFSLFSLLQYIQEQGTTYLLNSALKQRFMHSLQAYGLEKLEFKENTKFHAELFIPTDTFIAAQKKPLDAASLATLSLQVTVPFFVARQLEKHQIGFLETINEVFTEGSFERSGGAFFQKSQTLWSHRLAKNEVSRRYIDGTPEFYHPSCWRERPRGGIKQGSGDKSPHNARFVQKYASFLNQAKELYQQMLDDNLAPEQARMVLPLSAYTQWIWTASLADYARLCHLRLDAHTQKECQELAQEISTLCQKHYPLTWARLMS